MNPQFFAATRLIETTGLDMVALISIADGLIASGEAESALLLYKYWLLANPEHPLRHIAAFNCGSQSLQAGRFDDARKFLGQAIAASEDFYPARLNLATAHERAGDTPGAIAQLAQITDRLASVNPGNISTKVQAFKNMARIAVGEISETALRHAVELDPAQRELVQHWVNRRQGRCEWPAVAAIGPLSAQDVLERLAPLTVASYVDDPVQQLANAWRYSDQMATPRTGYLTLGEWPQPASGRPEKLRIGYLSSDFCNHAVGYLMSDVFENHDRSRFEITVFNIGEKTDDGIQQKIKGGVDAWFDIRGMADHEAAKLVVGRGIDIFVDMNGHTNFQRTRLLQLRPAPIIANWLGYPGTMGSDYHNYIIADDFLIPPEFEPFYSERVLRLGCYQPNGKLYQVPPVNATRAEFGIPDDAVVFCCFNGSVKITPQVYSRWIEILQRVPKGVIWLRGSADQDFGVKLRAEAVKRGIDPARFVFLPFRSNTEYLGCHRLADLFLDTFPYGAHTTASDALRMGVPIVTLAGLSFASRVCGSLSRAAGLPDLVCATPEQYVECAVELGNDPAKLAAAKQKLADALPTCRLFDPPTHVRELEALFETMWQAYSDGSLHRGVRPAMDVRCTFDPAPENPRGDFLELAEFKRKQMTINGLAF